MIRPPIYAPSGPALEYSHYGLNIYDSCPHGCTYCYARDMAKRFGKPWNGTVSVRSGLLEALHKQLARPEWKNAERLVHLCFTCDPYPIECDTTATRKVIRAIKESGNHVQILTKGGREAQRDFDLLDSNDRFGITFSGGKYEDEPGAATSYERFYVLLSAKDAGIKTWVSCEPVLNPSAVIDCIKEMSSQYPNAIDLWAIGKLNHRKSDVHWGRFGIGIETLCKRLGRNYIIKNDLRKEVEKEQCPSEYYRGVE